jgi:hypothetical protein
MLPGFSGHLISGQFLERHLAENGVPDDFMGVARRLLRWREAQRSLGPASSLRALVESGAAPLFTIFGFDTVDDIASDSATLSASIRGGSAPLALVVSGWAEPLDPLWRTGIRQAQQRAATWSVLYNGTHIRLVRADRVLSRRFVEFDLEHAIEDDRSAMALWTLLSRDAFRIDVHRMVTRLESLVDASDRHAATVCRSLREGVLDASEHVLRALMGRRSRLPPVDEAFAQTLTLVYRMLFLFFAEARLLVPTWHPVYRDSYSLETLRDAAVGRPAAGLWEALRAVSRLAHAGCRAGDLAVTPFNGGLFAPARTPLVDTPDLDDEAARCALVALSTRPAADREGREHIAYGDLGVEQLGAVYETLLDYRPEVRRGPGRGRQASLLVSLRAGSGVRKSTGSFYTPQTIASYLIRHTLAPLVRDATPEQILSLRVLDPSMGSGAFLVGACAYLADAYETALLRSGRCAPSDIDSRERAVIRRTIAERCLYGVDSNPMAVQLARLSLWLATLAADRPLSFLDHHLVAGDSVLGAWLSNLRRPPRGKKRLLADLPLFEGAQVGEVLRSVLPIRFSLALEPNDTLAQVRAKERALASLAGRETALSKWKRVADLWCARWFSQDLHTIDSLFPALSDVILAGHGPLPASTTAPLLARAETIAAEHHFFHWELEFPEVFFDETGTRRPDGGFDAIIGNPPWDMVRADGVAAEPSSDARDRAARVIRFTRDAGVYEAQSSGHANRYQLFLERSIALVRPHGRLGLVLPSGIASDQGSAPLRRLLFSRCDVDGLVGFDNRRAIFPIHRSVRFLLLSATAGAVTTNIGCRLGETDPAVLEQSETTTNEVSAPWFPVRLTPALLQALSGDDLSIPALHAPIDLVIAERAAATFPALGSEDGWGARFGRELNATDDRCAFGPAGRGLPIVEGKLLHPFEVRLDEAKASITPREATRRLGTRHLQARLAYRDVAGASNRVTLIAALLPAGCVSTHTVFCLKTALTLRAQLYLCALFNSLVVNYLVRLRVTTHVTTAIVGQLPIPRADHAGPWYDRLAAAGRVLSRHWRPDVFAWLNAQTARLYGLQEDEFSHLLGTFPLVPAADRDAALRAFRNS